MGASSVHLRHGEARRGQALEQSLGHGLAYAQHLARRLHLRPEDGVCIPKLFKGEHRHLGGKIRRSSVKSRAVAEARQRLTQHDL